MPDMIRDVVTTIQPLAQKNANRLEVHCPDDLGSMHADLTKVRQSLFNLLSNACKFTEDGTIRLEVARRGGGRGLDHLPGDRHGHRHRPPSTWTSCSSPSPRWTRRRRAGSAAPAWGWRSPATSARPWGATSRSRARRASAPRSPSGCRPRVTASDRTIPTDSPQAKVGPDRTPTGPGHRRRPGLPRPGDPLPRQGGIPGGDRVRRGRGAEPGPAAPPGADHPGRDDARHRRLGGAGRPEGGPGARGHPRHHAHDGGRPEQGVRAGGLRLPDQAPRPRPPRRDPPEVPGPRPVLLGPGRRGRRGDTPRAPRDAGEGGLGRGRGRGRACGPRRRRGATAPT